MRVPYSVFKDKSGQSICEERRVQNSRPEVERQLVVDPE
jgi:hypothetical protein